MEQRTYTTTQVQASESSFVSKVYLWMALGLAASAAGSLALLSQPALLRLILSNGILLFGLLIAEIGLVIWLSAGLMRMSPAMATSIFFGYSLLNGVTLTPILLIYTGASIVSTFAITAGTFFFFSLYGMTTKKDLTSIGGLAMMGLIGIVIASLVNLFLKSSGLYWVITFVGVAVFMGLVAYDTQQLKAMHAAGFGDETMKRRMTVLGALRLYLDFINLFLMLLRLFGRQRN